MAGFDEARIGRLRTALARHVEVGEVPGLVALVDRGGETCVEVLGAAAVGGPPMRRDTVFRIASMTKPVLAAVTLSLVEECLLRLDDPVDGWLPELAGRRVLRSLDAALEDTVPARRPITLRDLLTFRMGTGVVMAPLGTYPIQTAMAEAGLMPGEVPPAARPEEWLAALGALPLMYQPGEVWQYHTGSDVLGILVERAVGKPLGEVFEERIFAPLGMRDTGFRIPAESLDRFATAYRPSPAGLSAYDTPADSAWSAPVFASGGGGLVSTADDYLAFCRMLLAEGRIPAGRGSAGRLLSRASVRLMTTDQLTAGQREAARLFFGESRSWGMGCGVTVRRDELWGSPGRFGWDGGAGTSGYADPAEDLVGVLLTQRSMTSPEPPPVFRDFWTSAYQAIDA
ncbi:serine hydrolase [Kitasatospora sp. MMS16-BH015]|uniref:serine hydrolase domain-containing protein n=1 Tax=Kitasatospora sp. MMS16-BH015 TaxID=2018025 RepID=UPI000CA14B39|nr:serine hydrolase domain-containing protein [Kitasatospora sp. MMS16-BH015]AUG75915.1 serine hydrolase [Kitasatospora sp. MMS16-BH015]